jgi:poly-gamma-glutamate synthesis protein (capsule biosynthesis protein)
MKRFHFVLALLLLPSLKSNAGDILFYGDVMLSRGIERYVEAQGAAPITRSFSPFLSQCGVNVVNLEGCVASEVCRGADTTLCFRIQPRLLSLFSGFNVVSLENNHAFDAGLKAAQRTAQALGSMNIIALSCKSNSTIVKTDQGNVAIVAATDVLNDTACRANLVMADSPGLVEQIRRLKETCGVVIVYVHWGRELLAVATERMRQIASSYVDAGADVVVGTHPHVTGPVDVIKGKPIVYSLGNFFFDQKYPDTKKGALLSCTISDNGVLCCRLSACETQMNSFVPFPAPASRFDKENEQLSSCATPVTRTWTGVFTRDGREKCLRLQADKKFKGLWKMEILDSKSMKLEAQTPAMPIRKLQPVNLSSGRTQQIMLIQSMYSKFDKETAQRLYIYSFDKGFHALWRGTALSRPLIDAVFSMAGDSVRLVALHSSDSFLLRDNTCTGRIVAIYRWNGFGFTGVKEIKIENGCNALTLVPGGIRVSANGITKRMLTAAEVGERNAL